MEILFKDDFWLYHIENGIMECTLLDHVYHTTDLDEVQHLDDTDIIYHIYDNFSKAEKYPVYYEHLEHDTKLVVVAKGDRYVVMSLNGFYTKDYTIVNIKLI